MGNVQPKVQFGPSALSRIRVNCKIRRNPYTSPNDAIFWHISRVWRSTDDLDNFALDSSEVIDRIGFVTYLWEITRLEFVFRHLLLSLLRRETDVSRHPVALHKVDYKVVL